MNRVMLRDQLIDSLTEDEQIVLAEELSKIRGRFTSLSQVAPASKTLRFFRGSEIFGFLHQKIFGEWKYHPQDCQRIIDELRRVRDFLQKKSVDSIFLKERNEQSKVSYPWMPDNLCVSNDTEKDVLVTLHAWKRFCERCYPNQHNSDRVAKVLQNSFKRARPVNLKIGNAVKRQINNDFVPADYFLDISMNCRFVIISADDRRVISTVERPSDE